jgi:glutamate-5-semialdehyde dehydrogenase
MSKIHEEALQLATTAREASPALANATSGAKNAALAALATKLQHSAKSIFSANAKDLKLAKESGLAPAMIDRLTITKKRLDEMIAGVQQVAMLADPVGAVIDGWTRPNGLRLSRVRVPLGVALIIFESRPNVTIDAAALCLKSGNAAILRGGKEAVFTNQALGRCLQAALTEAGLPAEALQVVKNTDRSLVQELLHMDRHINVVIPRGGRGLIEAIIDNSRIPVIKHLDGICHIYVDTEADFEMAQKIIMNAKVQRPGVCNALETLLVHKNIARKFLPPCLRELRKAGVELRADKITRNICKGIRTVEANEEDWGTEYLDLILSIGVVSNLDQAIQHINNYGSHHTDAIITQDVYAANRFKREVDSASVMVNASTRFADGFEYGLGAEIGISTDKLHARGPVGLEGMTTYKWLVEGEGQIRG